MSKAYQERKAARAAARQQGLVTDEKIARVLGITVEQVQAMRAKVFQKKTVSTDTAKIHLP